MTQPAQASKVECFICGRTDRETEVHEFDVLYYRCVEPVCEECLSIETDEWKDGPWRGDTAKGGGA